MAARQGEASVSKEDGSAVSKPPLDTMGKAKAATDAAVFVASKLDDVRKAMVNNKDALKAISSAMGGVLTGLTAVPYVGIVAQLAKSLLEQADKNSAIGTFVDETMKETLDWFQKQDLDKVLGSQPRTAESLQELKKTMVEAEVLAQTIKGKGWGNRFFLAVPYEEKLKGKLDSLKEVRAKLGLEATWASVEKLDRVLDLLQANRPEAITAKHNVQEVDPLFGGREDILKRMYDALWESAGTSAGSRTIVCLWGIRGIGKTQLARKYCHENLSRYGRVLWVDVQGKGAQGGYADLGGDVLGLTRAPGEQLEDFVKHVRLKVQNLTEPFLMVFDGANGETVSELQELVPGERQACHVLVTTTDDWALRQHGAVPLAVESLRQDQARVLLKKGLAVEREELIGEGEKKLDELAKRLGYLTIALAGAVPLLVERRSEGDPAGKLLAELGELGGVGPVNKLFKLSLLSMGHSNTGEDGSDVVCGFAASIAMVAGWFGEGPVSTKLLLEAAKRYHVAVHGAADGSLWDNGALTRKALLRVTHYLPAQLAAGFRAATQDDTAPQEGLVTLTFHVLFLEYMRRPGLKGAETAKAATLATVAGVECDKGTVQQFKGVWDVVVMGMDVLEHSDLEMARKLGSKYAAYLHGSGSDYKGAKTVLESGLETFGKGPQGWAWRLELTHALDLLGEFTRAEELVEGVLKELERRNAASGRHQKPDCKWWISCFKGHGGSLDTDGDAKRDFTDLGGWTDTENARLTLARAWHVQASIYYKQGRHAEALQLNQHSLRVKEEVLGPDHIDVAATLDNMARVLVRQSKLEEALPLYKRALDISEKAAGLDHPMVAYTLGSMAPVLVRQGKNDEAMALYQRSLRISKRALGPEHPRVAVTLNNMASLFQNQGEYEMSLQLYQQSKLINEKALGQNHPAMALTLNNMGTLLHIQGEYGEALPLFERALETREKVLGLEHPDVAVTLNDMGILLHNQSRYEEALPLYKRALGILEKALGQEHPDTKTLRDNSEEAGKKVAETASSTKQQTSSYTRAERTEGPLSVERSFMLTRIQSGR